MRKEAFIVAIALILFMHAASANTSPIIQDLPSEITLCEGSSLSQSFSVTDAEDGQMTFGISPDSPFFVRSTPVSTATTNAELYSGNLTKEQSNKRYPLTIFVSDEGRLVDTQQVLLTVMEINNPPKVSHIGVQTLVPGQEFKEQLYVEDIETGTNLLDFAFNISSDFKSPNVSITDTGAIRIIPLQEDVGLHNVEVCVTDTGIPDLDNKIGFCGSDSIESTTCERFQVAVVETNTPPTILLYNSSFNMSTILLGTQPYTFSVYKFDPEEVIPETYWYVDKTLKKIGTGAAEDAFTYTFGCGVFGFHSVEAVVSDGALNDSVVWNLDIARTTCVPGVPQQPIIGESTCSPLWGCGSWDVCQELEQSSAIGIISSEDASIISSGCSTRNIDPSECGFQIRSCTNLNSCYFNSTSPLEIQACRFSSSPSCSDGIKNCHDGSCEFVADCGGPCDVCATCSNNIKDPQEQGADCGGVCSKACPARTISASEKNIKQYIMIAMAILIVFSLLQISFIFRQKKKLDEPSKRGVKNVKAI